MSAPAATDPAADRPWFIATRWEQYQAEGRANLLRLIALCLFYSVEVARYYGVPLDFLELPPAGPNEAAFHWAIASLTALWVVEAAVVAWLLRLHFFPRWLPYASTAADLVLLTTALMIGHGPQSPLLVAYFVVLAMAALRVDLPLIWFAAGGAAAGYLFLLGYARWYAPERDLRVPRFHELLFLVGLALTAVVLGQLVRRVRRLAADYARRTARRKGARREYGHQSGTEGVPVVRQGKLADGRSLLVVLYAPRRSDSNHLARAPCH